ncbi:hypothetical protein [Modestobacter sp. NPDC049651]|uniref:hypothetical protein n=1 Tax=unclassified Modestobacter TaxID=2643866 RepID=UPI0033DA74D5
MTDADGLLVSASCWLDGPVDLLTDAGRAALTTDAHGRPVLHLPTARVEAADPVARQLALEQVLRGALDQLAACGVYPDLVRTAGAQVRLSLSLCPVDGSAGVVLAADMLLPWLRLGADVFVDAQVS